MYDFLDPLKLLKSTANMHQSLGQHNPAITTIEYILSQVESYGFEELEPLGLSLPELLCMMSVSLS